MFVLTSRYIEGEQNFTANESDVAFSVAKAWAKQGLAPTFYHKTYDGHFKFYPTDDQKLAA